MEQNLKTCYKLIEDYYSLLENINNEIEKLATKKSENLYIGPKSVNFEEEEEGQQILSKKRQTKVLKTGKENISEIMNAFFDNLEKSSIKNEDDFENYQSCITNANFINFDINLRLFKAILLTKFTDEFNRKFYVLVRQAVEKDSLVAKRLLKELVEEKEPLKDEKLFNELKKFILHALHREFDGKGEDAVYNNFFKHADNFKIILHLDDKNNENLTKNVLNDQKISQKVKNQFVSANLEMSERE